MMPSDSKFPPVPQSIVTASRSEMTDLKLNIRESKLADGVPHDLRGHLFIVAPVGSVESDGLPYADGDAIFNGDGMIYRLDFNSPQEVLLQSRLAKTPCYYADEATQTQDEYQEFRFRNRGLTRFSSTLGSRNQLNTAFLSFSSSSDEQERLLLTYDAGRPYEIDPETLEVVTPVGTNSEWHSEVSLNFPFPPVLGTAHPTFDPNSQEIFTINYGRSLNNLLEAIPFIHDLEELPQEIDAVLAKIRQFFPKILQKIILNFFSQASDCLYNVFRSFSTKFIGLEDFVYLIRWDGQGLLERWKVVLSDGTPVRIEQTMHQIGMTQDYLVLIDTNFKAGMSQVYNNPFPHHAELERLLREILANPVLPNSTVYIVRRQDLKKGQYPAHNDPEVTVIAKKLVLPLPLIHFTLDYENPDHQMTLYAVHNCGDLAEWVRQYDTLAFAPQSPVRSKLLGMPTEEIDISRLGRYTINGETGELVQSKVLYDTKLTWGTIFLAYRERLGNGQLPKRLESIYWHSTGFWHELLTEFIFELYQDVCYRAITTENLLSIPEHGIGRPPSLLRLDTQTMTIADFYEFPLLTADGQTWDSHMISSPEFIPRTEGSDRQTDGYLFCTVYTLRGCEFWIFDAQDLAQGPLCKLEHPSLKLGSTVHTAWLPKIARRTANYYICAPEDYQSLVAQQPDKIQVLFQTEIYPHFPKKENSNNLD